MRPDRCLVRAWIRLGRATRWAPYKAITALGQIVEAWRRRR